MSFLWLIGFDSWLMVSRLSLCPAGRAAGAAPGNMLEMQVTGQPHTHRINWGVLTGLSGDSDGQWNVTTVIIG